MIRTPVFPQLKSTECGAACLGMVLGYYGRWAAPEELREACGVARDGSTAADIVRAARRYGLEASGWTKSLEELADVPLPAICFVGFDHFVVLEGFRRGRYYVNDPANGRRSMSAESFSRTFTGVVLVLEPGPEFRAGGVRPGIVRKLWPWLTEVKTPLAFAALCGLMLAVPGLAVPGLLNVFVDRVLAGAQTEWSALIVAAAVLAGVLVYVLVWLQQRCLARLAVRLSVVHGERFLSRLFRLPVQFFSQRLAGDLTMRAQLVDFVSTGASAHFVGVMIELTMCGVFLVAMVVYDPLMAVLVAVLGVSNAACMRFVHRHRSDENRQMQRERALLAGIGLFGLRSMDSLRATAAEDDFFARWSGYQARELAARHRFTELGYTTADLPGLFMMLSSAALVSFGGWRVITGDLTLGGLMAFLVLAGSFMAPIGRFVLSADAFGVLDASLHQINDVLDAPSDVQLAPGADHRTGDSSGHGADHRTGESSDHGAGRGSGGVATLGGRLRLAGRLELRDVTFGHRPNRAPLIEDFGLTIEAGQRVAVVGPTGSGKSTLLKMVSGEYTPWSGEILFDGIERSRIPREVLTGSVSVVDQQIFLFAAPVRDNLTLWNPTVPDHHLVAAATDAQIHDEIMGRPSGYDSTVEEEGRNFSGGQRQRLEIARALVDNPSVILLDEATSALDAVTEVMIDDALRRRGCTCLIVAHRLSTIRDCDQIIVMDRGRAVERGTHEQLYADESGLYRRLVQAQ